MVKAVQSDSSEWPNNASIPAQSETKWKGKIITHTKAEQIDSKTATTMKKMILSTNVDKSHSPQSENRQIRGSVGPVSKKNEQTEACKAALHRIDALIDSASDTLKKEGGVSEDDAHTMMAAFVHLKAISEKVEENLPSISHKYGEAQRTAQSLLLLLGGGKLPPNLHENIRNIVDELSLELD